MMAGPAVMYTATTALTFVVALAVMLSIDWRLTLIALLPLPPVTLASRYFGRAIHERFERIQAQLSDLSAVTQEALAGVRVVRAYRQEARELARFRDANLEYVERNRALIRLQGIFYPSMGFFMGCAEMLVLWRGSLDVIAGRLTVGELVAFSAYLAMLAWPMVAFGWVTNLVQRGRASWGRMREILEIVPAIDDRDVAYPDLKPEDVRGDVRIDNLSFAYGDTPLLTGISLAIQAGQTVGVVGRTGSGKSTLLSLLARLHDPPPGTVFVDGKDVRTIPLATLRGAMGVVPQEPFLFSDTIEGNVAFGSPHEARLKPGPTTELNADNVVGAGLQPGQAPSRGSVRNRATRQGCRRVSARLRHARGRARHHAVGRAEAARGAGARALRRSARPDPGRCAVVGRHAYRRRHPRRAQTVPAGRTTLIVAHRLSTVRDADLIVVLDRGTIVEQGTHATLVARNGVYAEILRQQLLEQELEAS
jgi:ATP-binding cassette, subfamily B, multidrug efflux pump